MIVSLKVRQWNCLVAVIDTDRVVGAPEEVLDVDRSIETGRQRGMIAAAVRPLVAARTADQITHELDEAHVLWSRYRTMVETTRELWKSSTASILTGLDQQGGGVVPSIRSPICIADECTGRRSAPRGVEGIDRVLGEVLGLSDPGTSEPHARGVIADGL